MNFKFARNEEAVSPVIGVILMVAITVILAAVIASFVFGIGSRAPQSAPQAQLMVADASDELSDTVNGQDVFYIKHAGGESIMCNETKIIIRNQDDSINTELRFNITSEAYDYQIGGAQQDIVSRAIDDQKFDVGDIIYFNETGTRVVDTNTVFKLEIIDMQSNQLIFSGDVQVW